MSTQKPGDYFKKRPSTQQVYQIGFFQQVSSGVTNLKYNASRFFDSIFTNKQQLIENRSIIIQGRNYKNRKSAKQAVQKIIWFSYRKGVKIDRQHTSDVGWGCLVRVGQMALASAIFKYVKSQPYVQLSDQTITQTIIGAFSDIQGRQQKYSLNIMLQVAKNEFKYKNGQWFNLSKISQTMRIVQNKHPMKGLQNLQVVFFDQSFNVSTLFQLEGITKCNCARPKVVCQQCHKMYLFQSKDQTIYIKQSNGLMKSQIGYQDTMGTMNESMNHNTSTLPKSSSMRNSLNKFIRKRFKRDLYVLLLTRAIDHQDPQKINKAVFTLLDLQFCQGIMTGFPRKAIFVIGRQQDQLIYLDPHYVQKNTSFWSRDNDETYSCKQYHKTTRDKLDRSMTFCFYLQNLQQLSILVSAIQKVDSKYSDSLLLYRNNDKQDINFKDYQQSDQQQDSISKISSFKL